MSINLKDKVISEFSNFEQKLNGSKSSLLHSIRKQALEYFSKTGFPTMKNEDWRFTNINFINKYDFSFQFHPDDSNVTDADIEKFLIKDYNQNLLVFVNGFYSQRLSKLKPKGERIWIGSFADALNKRERLIEYYFNQYSNYEKDPFIALNTAYATDVACMCIFDSMEVV